jgi:hypothetical protein
MKVFMSWSGSRSKAAAELLHDWIKCVIQATRPWISTRGIDRGALWFSEIHNELKDTTVGIICLTKENKVAPWILFEAGALAKGLTTNRVCTFLVDLTPNDIQDPLAQFNHTLPNRESVWNLVVTLNACVDSQALEPRILEQVFSTYWPEFERRFAEIENNYPAVTIIPDRDEKELLGEILNITRGLEKRMRQIETTTYSNSSVKQRINDRILRSREHRLNGVPLSDSEYRELVQLRDSAKSGMPYDSLVEFARSAGLTVEDLTKFMEDPSIVRTYPDEKLAN